jgi:uncharacterized membrane protein
MLRPLTRCFLAGLFTLLPLVVTVAVVIWVAGFLDRLLGPQTAAGQLLGRVGLNFVSSTAMAYALGWAVVLAAVFGVGVLVELGAKRFIHDRLDSLVARVPLLGGVYGTVRQLVGMMDPKGSADLQGMSVVYCVFGKETGAAFLALLPTPQVFRLGEIDYHAVLVPSAPVPMGGSLLFVPVGSVRPANLTVDAFMSIYVSMGVTGPQFMPCSVGA